MKKYYKKNRILITIIVIGVVGMVVASGIFIWTKKEKEAKASKTISVYVVNEKVSPGDKVEDTVSLSELELYMSGTLPDNLITTEDLKGRYKIGLGKGVILTKDMIALSKEVTGDKRLHNFSYIELNDKLSKGDYIDIRISFADGSDYVVLAKKKIEDLSVYNPQTGTENALWLEISAEEILRMSSAAVDGATKENCRLYAIKYISELQEEAKVTYPVNQIVKLLIESDPNIVKRAEQFLDDGLRDKIDGLSDGDSYNASGNDLKNEGAGDIGGSDLKNEFESSNSEQKPAGPDEEDSLVYDIYDDEEIEYLD